MPSFDYISGTLPQIHSYDLRGGSTTRQNPHSNVSLINKLPISSSQHGLLSFKNQILYNKKNSIFIATLRYFNINDNLHLIHKVNYSVETFDRTPKNDHQTGQNEQNIKDVLLVPRNQNEYIQIDIWTNGSLSPRKSLLNAFKKLFEIFYTLSKDNFIKPIGF